MPFSRKALAQPRRAFAPELRRRVLGTVEEIRKAWGRLALPGRALVIKLLVAEIRVLDKVPTIRWRTVAELDQQAGAEMEALAARRR